MLEAIRELNKELKLQSLIMDRYIPEDYQTQLEAHSAWSEDTGEWHMVSVCVCAVAVYSAYSFVARYCLRWE